MNIQARVRTTVVAVCVAALALGSTASFARGFAGGQVVARGGFGHGFGGYRGGYGYGYHGGYRGGYYGGWGALGLGLFVASLPLYYSTYYWNGVPYYYADDYYYRYDGGARRYERVTPPSGPRDQAATPAGLSAEVFAYPKNGQTEEQQAKDKDECKNWARTQVGSADSPDPGTPSQESRDVGYVRAQTACLEGRGYSVK